jgi:glyoxylase-like metal-dependent hydrolase (beta-lactamase superfamily II)
MAKWITRGSYVKPIRCDFRLNIFCRFKLDHVISPEIRLTPSTGRTPGHVSVTIESEGERAVITGDMLHHPRQLAHPDWVLGDNDPEAAKITRARLFGEWADQSVLVIGTHFPAPTAALVVRDGAAFRLAV